VEGQPLNPGNRLTQYAAVLCAVAVLPAGCGSPSSVAGAPPASKFAVRSNIGRSWMSPKTRSSDLLYASTGIDGAIYVYTYPKGQLVGGLLNTGKSYGLCSDPNGNVFVTNDNATYEYPQGSASASATLTSPYGGTTACSVDPVSGDLAVVAPNSGIAIFHPMAGQGWHIAKLFPFEAPHLSWCAYAASGDLFVDGYASGNYFVWVLEKGKLNFKRTILDKRFLPASIQWDGQHMAIEDSGQRIHRFKFNGATGTQVGVTRLKVFGQVFQFWIQGPTLTAAANQSAQPIVGEWPYPAGGKPQREFTQDKTYGVTVSVAPSNR
jgi:hypothetical protein